MRKLLYYTMLSLLLCGAVACKDSSNDDAILTRVVPSTLDPLPAQSYILQAQGGDDKLLFTATWTETLFYLNSLSTPEPMAPVKYSLQVAKAGENFEHPYTLASTPTLVANIYAREFNLLLVDSLGATPNEPFDVELRIKVNYSEDARRTTVSTNTIPLSVTTYEDRNLLLPVYIIGDMNGWNTTDVNNMLILFKDNSDTRNYTFTYTGYLPQACNFKFLPHEALGTTATFSKAGDNLMEYTESGGASFYNETAGYKTVTIDLKNLTFSLQDYNVGGAINWGFMGFIGEFCGWDNEPAMARLAPNNNHIWKLDQTLDVLPSGRIHPVKFRAERSWNTRWIATDPTAVPYGKAMYITVSTPDPNIEIPEGGNYRIFFNDLTGHYIMLKR